MNLLGGAFQVVLAQMAVNLTDEFAAVLVAHPFCDGHGIDITHHAVGGKQVAHIVKPDSHASGAILPRSAPCDDEGFAE